MKTKELFTNFPKLSLKRICDELNICYQYVLKASKKPIPNEPYDPSSTNYDEIDKILDRKQINLDDYDWKSIEDSIKVYEPINKVEDFDIDTEFKMRGSDDYYKVIYKTETHIVFIQIDSTQPRVMNWDTFLHQSPRIIK